MSKTTNSAAWSDAQVKELHATASKTDTGLMDNSLVKSLTTNSIFAGKTAASLRGKAVSLKLYKAADPTQKAGNAEGERQVRKLDFVHTIETLTNMPRDALSTLEKGSKAQLEALARSLVAMSDDANANS